jgi:hypothetical protein
MVAALLAILLLPSIAYSGSQDSKPTHYQVKAAYLYQFGGFVEWSATAKREDVFFICVLGADPFGATLDAVIRGEVIDNSKITAKRISKVEDALTCRVLFIASSEERQLGPILTALQKSKVLTVSDIPQFAERGGMIQFVQDGNKVRFEVNLAPAERSGLTLSSQLLKLAVKIRND